MLLEFDGTFIFALISFIIFVTLMNFILYRPIMKVIAEREKLLNDNNDIVSKSQKKADEAKKFHENEILSARAEASDLLSDVQNSLKIQKDAKIKVKKEEILNKIFQNEKILLGQKDEAKASIKDEIENHVKMAVLNVFGKENININDIKVDKNRLNDLLEVRK